MIRRLEDAKEEEFQAIEKLEKKSVDLQKDNMELQKPVDVA